MDDKLFINRLRESIPLEVEDEDPHAQLREFSQLLLVFPIVVLIIFGSSQLAVFNTTTPTFAESNSSLFAEYAPWPYILITGLRGGIVDEIYLDTVDGENTIEVFSDPVAISATWVDEDAPPIIVAELPTGAVDNPSGSPGDDSSGSEDDGPSPTEEPSPTVEWDPIDEPSPTNSGEITSTATTQATTTVSPQVTQTYTPIPTIPSIPTFTPTDPPTQPPTSTPVPTNTPPVVTDTPTSPPPPPIYCVNIHYNKVGVEKQGSSHNRVWKFYMNIYNGNTIPMYLVDYQVSWSNDSDLHLNRAQAIPNPNTGARVTLSAKKRYSPTIGCIDCPVEFIPRPRTIDAEVYNMFCNDYPCVEANPQNDIPAGTYSFQATGVFVFYPPVGGFVSCPFSKSVSVSHP